MMKSITVIAALLSAAFTTATPLERRDPSDKSGNSHISYDCTDLTIPNPGGAEGQGEGGTGIFTHSLSFTDKDGKSHGADCEKDDSTCIKCTIKDGPPSPIEVQACHFPIAGTCNIEFDYGGHHYDTSKKDEHKCGHEGGGFQPFSSSQTALCYFDE